MVNQKYVGSSFDDFLAEEGIEKDVTAIAADRVFAWQLEQLVMQKENINGKTSLD